jgi:uncharacterized protein (DUF849 family)
MVPDKGMTPHVPISPDEILEDVAACIELGAAMIHVHARDEHGVPTHRAEAFAPIIEGIRAIDPQVVVVATCSGRRGIDVDRRAEVLDLTGDARPDMASLTLGSNNFHREASVNPPETIAELARRMAERDIRPELEVFEPGMVQYGRHLAEKGLIAEPCYVNVLLGNIATSPVSAATFAAFQALIPETWTWALAGIGRAQLDANTLGIALGGHVRVGLEDNIWWDRERTTLARNADLVGRIARLAELAERPLATPAQVRERLGLRLRTAV